MLVLSMTLPLSYPLPFPLLQILAIWGSREIDVFKVQGGARLFSELKLHPKMSVQNNLF